MCRKEDQTPTESELATRFSDFPREAGHPGFKGKSPTFTRGAKIK